MPSNVLPVSSQNVPYLDGWRGLAISLVLLCHFESPHFGWAGTFGVMLFFVLSGLLMGQLLFVKETKLDDFFARRISRVLPTFWFYASVMVLYSIYVQPTRYYVGWREGVSTFFFLSTYLPSHLDIWSENWPNGHFWSLNVEEHSYIYLAVGAAACRCFRNRLAAPIFLFSSVSVALFLTVFYQYHPPDGASPWYLRSEVASLALLSAAALRVGRDRFQFFCASRVPALLPVLSFLAALLACILYSYRGFDRTFAPILLAFTVVYLDRVPKIFKTALTAVGLRRLGLAAFSLYLWQQPFYLATLHFGLSKGVGLVMAVCAGASSFYLLEDPVRRLLNSAWTALKVRRQPLSTSDLGIL
jgi:peptidoglycan/LPS O-acetylase OafA/YrhL